MTKSSPPTKLQTARANFRAVSSPDLFEFACPFCAKTEVSMFMGKVNFSATIGNEELCNPVKVTLAALICAKSHVFFVLESDLATALTSAAA
jgi:hypothetical protein